MISGEPGYSLAQRMEHHGVPGASVALIEGREIQWVRHYGVADVRDQRPVDDSTIFNVGSMSKAVTCATILVLARDGLVELDLPVNEQLSSWTLPENEFTSEAAVTPLRLMNHSGGTVFSPGFSYRTENLPSLRQLLEGGPPARSAPIRVDEVPGTTFQYSNAGYTVLRLLAEEATGQPFEEVARERIFEPLGMIHSTFETPLSQHLLADAAMGHRTDGTVDAAVRRYIGHMAAGGMWTTATDYATFVIEIQRALVGESTNVLDRELAEMMVSPHEAEQYGLGIFRQEPTGERQYVGHIGDGPGFVGGYAFVTDGEHAVVALSNGQDGINLIREIRRSIAKVYGWPDYLESPKTPVDLDPVLAERAAGRYRLGFDQVVEVGVGDGALLVDISGLPRFRMHQMDDETFVTRERAGEIRFQRDGNGDVPSMILHLSDSLGRLGSEPRSLPRMEAGDQTPLEQLLGGETEMATSLYRELFASDPNASEISENRLNGLGYQYLWQDRPEEAVAVFRLYAALYPDSANAHDSLGEALMKSGRVDESLASYQRSLELDATNFNAKEMIDSLQRAQS
jgi:CubicO group peptidase (beta-lactamase class C family)